MLKVRLRGWGLHCVNEVSPHVCVSVCVYIKTERESIYAPPCPKAFMNLLCDESIFCYIDQRQYTVPDDYQYFHRWE